MSVKLKVYKKGKMKILLVKKIPDRALKKDSSGMTIRELLNNLLFSQNSFNSILTYFLKIVLHSCIRFVNLYVSA